MSYFDDDGNEVDLVSKEELERIKKELEEKQAALEAAQAKDYDWRAMRTQLKDKKDELSDKDRVIAEKLAELEDRQVNSLNKQREELITRLSGEDEELRKKIDYHYKRFSDKEDSLEDVIAKVKDAALLATGTPIPTISPVNSAYTFQGTTPKTPEVSPVSEGFKDLAGKLGLSEEDLKKIN